MNDLIQRILHEFRKIWFIPVMVILGIFLMVIQYDQPESIQVASVSADEQYIRDTEARIEEMLKGIDGVGACDVTITLASGSKKEYVREEGNVLVISDNNGNQSAVISKEIAPEIAGVTVLCRGAYNIKIQKDIIHSVSTVLGIGSNKVCVISSEEE